MSGDVDEFDAYPSVRARRSSCRAQGLLLGPGVAAVRKSVEPMAAHIDPLDASAKHQSLHDFVAEADWSDRVVLQWVREWVMPALGAHAAEENRLLRDYRRHRFSKEGTSFGRGGTSVLRTARKTGQLSGRREPVDHDATQRPACCLAVVCPQGMA